MDKIRNRSQVQQTRNDFHKWESELHQEFQAVAEQT